MKTPGTPACSFLPSSRTGKWSDHVLMNSLQHHCCPALEALHPAGAGGLLGDCWAAARLTGRGTCSVRLLVAAAITNHPLPGGPRPHLPPTPLGWACHRERTGGGGTLANDWSRTGPRVLSEPQGDPGRGLLESRIQPPHGSPVPT